MASTPPAQITLEARTPPTPLHGSAYHAQSSPSRYNTRSNAQKTPGSVDSSFTQSSPPNSLRSPPRLSRHSNLQFQFTPKRKRAIQVISPASPDSDSNTHLPVLPQNHSYLSSTTIMAEGMLPTPVKTPQKKDVKHNMAARALFQDQLNPIASPRKSVKKRRFNGFSLESFTENSDQNSIQIYTDSRDQVPEVDTSEENPFYTKPESNHAPTSSNQKVKRSSKRRKISAEKPLDPQVEDAIKNDEGMVYVFRGKKVYRKFDDFGDEEEVIDPEELGLLQYKRNGREITTPLKTLTRKSIKPRRLFQTKQDQQPPKASQSDEEAETEIEDEANDHDQDISELEELQSPSRTTRRSRAQKPSSSTTTAPANPNPTTEKKSSPFDSWKRMKSGGRPSSTSLPGSAKGRKRTAAEALEV